jgi:hypothetical protein
VNSLLEAMQLIETARAKIIEYRKTIVEADVEDSNDWLIDGNLEEASNNCRGAIENIELALQPEEV